MTEQAKLPVYLLVAIASTFIIMMGIKAAAAIINPILLALIITIAVLPLPNHLVKRGMSGKVALVLTILAVLGIILAVILLFVGSLYALQLKMPTYAANIAERSQELSALLDRVNFAQTSIELDPKSVRAFAGRLLASAAGTVVQIFMTMLIFIFMLSAALSLPTQSQKSMEESTSLVESIRTFTSDVSQYVTVTTVINFLVGLGDAIFLMILGVDFALLWGLLAWFLGYIPTIGFWLALIPPTILAWAEHGVGTATIVFLGFVLINGSVQNFLQPKMMGDNLNISPIIVFLSLFIWGWLLGAIGAILAVPMTLMILTIFDQFESTRVIVRLIRPSSGDAMETQQAKEEIGGLMDKMKDMVGFKGNKASSHTTDIHSSSPSSPEDGTSSHENP